MAEFKDLNGKPWTLALDGPKIRKIRELCKVDPVGLDGKFFLALEDDPLILFDACYVLCEDQLGAISVQQFYAALVGDATPRAQEALTAAVFDFFPNESPKKKLLGTLLEKWKTLRGLQMLKAESLMPEVEKQLEKIRQELTQPSSATNGPESAESDPTGSPSENSTG